MSSIIAMAAAPAEEVDPPAGTWQDWRVPLRGCGGTLRFWWSSCSSRGLPWGGAACRVVGLEGPSARLSWRLGLLGVMLESLGPPWCPEASERQESLQKASESPLRLGVFGSHVAVSGPAVVPRNFREAKTIAKNKPKSTSGPPRLHETRSRCTLTNVLQCFC